MTIFEIMKHCLLLRGAPLENSYRHAINKKLHTSILLQIVIKIIRKFFFFLAQFLCYFIISKKFSVTNAKLKQFTGHKNQNEKLTGTHTYVFNQAENKQAYAI